MAIGKLGAGEYRIAIQGHVRSYERADFGVIRGGGGGIVRPIAYLLTSTIGGAVGAAVA